MTNPATPTPTDLPEPLRLAALMDAMDYDDTRAAAAELRRLHAENQRLSELCDKWNTECDEFREDNKRLAALSAAAPAAPAIPTLEQLPEWGELSERVDAGQPLTPLEQFIYDNEDADPGNATPWRASVLALVQHYAAPKARQAGAESYPPELDDAFSVARSALVHCPDRASVLVILATLRSRVDDTIDALRARGAVPSGFLQQVITLCGHRGPSPYAIERWSKDDKWIADIWREAERMLAAPAAVSAPSEGDALAPLRAWWAMHEAQWELCEETPADDAIILQFMGSGASTAVTAGQLRAVLGNTTAPQAQAQEGGAA